MALLTRLLCIVGYHRNVRWLEAVPTGWIGWTVRVKCDDCQKEFLETWD